MQAAREYAAEHNLTLDARSYQDLGISAFKGENAENGALAAFMKAVDDKIIPRGTVLLVESLDRITRQDPDIAAELFLRIVRSGITIVTLIDRHVYSSEQIKRDRGMSLMAAIMFMARANEESATKSDRIKKRWDAKVASSVPLTRTGPAWLKLVGAEWKRVAKKVAIVQKVFELAAAGHGALKIANALNGGRTPTPTLGKHKNKAEAWTVGIVGALLKNQAVIGTLNRTRTKEPSISGYYGKPIIDPAVFDAVQLMIKGRSHYGGPQGKSISNLFTGLLKCECGRTMKFVSGAKPHLYIQCEASYSGAKLCDGRKIPYQKVEAAVLEWLLAVEDHDFEKPSVLADPRIMIRAKLEETQAELGQRFAMLGRLKDSDALDRVGREIDSLSVRKRELERELREGGKAMPVIERLGRPPSPLARRSRRSRRTSASSTA